jgi:hypothetical protein
VKKLVSIFNFYIKSSLHLSLCVLSLIIITCLRFDLDFSCALFVCVFCATIVVYNFIKYASTLPYYFFTKNAPIKKIQILSFVSGFFLFISVFFLNSNTRLLGSVLFLFCLTYVIPFNRSSINIRNYSKIKIFIVAFCWAGSTVLMPFSEGVIVNLSDTTWLFIQRFIFIFVYTLPFEIRDLQYDSIKLKTIPQVIGINKTKILAYLLLIIFCIMGFFIESNESKFLLSDIIIAFITAIFIFNTKVNQSKYYTSFLIEGLPIYWLIVILIIENII